ncbi:TetR family transcriptional regulator [Roseiarcus fermentans]|uniref:TetR family transcriptional regulator n=1 Tax=Roseiarcus fermentans TaxID=1473586 RepID=A0A366ENP5_9HYPH|nr:TetR/AcrR family transcriptional regulator [Roseiarcus fermentans]RBP04037.1 TetR family transcriptional regulator [Roseiarcus fermentans]
MGAESLEQEVVASADGGAKRRQIMDGARAVFFAAGFDGASMNDIARSAGVSKGTIYAHFGSKEDLFKEIIREQKAQTAERLCVFGREGDVRDMLADFGRSLMRKLTDPGHISLGRIVIGAAEKFPAVGRALYEAGPLYGATRLAAELSRLEDAGVLRLPDPERAAWQFIDLCQSRVYKQVLFGVVESADPKEIDASVAAAVEVFMKAYGA